MPPKKDKNKANFVEDVGGFPFLWDKQEDDYKNKTKVDEKWKDLASDHGFEGNFIFKVLILF